MDIRPLLELYKYSAHPIGIFYVIFVIGMAFGALLIWQPRKIIKIALYKPFNWKIEPISMKKEIRNTRIMGMVVFIFTAISLIYIILVMK